MKKMLLLISLAGLSFYLFSDDENKGYIDLNNLDSYESNAPNYISDDNTPNNNQITDIGATLGRVLFYDKKLSVDNTIACASCHKQSNAFGDPDVASTGVAGTTGRHSMRLVNARFANERKFFWDERANSLEEQTTMPIQDHIEMGFSGVNGDPDFDSLIIKLSSIDYYQELFNAAYGDINITERRIQNAIAQFVRSIESFDTKFDEGRILAANDIVPFSNFTQEENRGKNLFIAPPQFNQNRIRMGGGLGCGGCHNPPEFDIAPNSRNNGIVSSFTEELDLDVTRSPSIRDIFDYNGNLNSPLMHNGISLDEVIDHYNQIEIVAGNNNLDPRLTPGGNPQNLNMNDQERSDLIDFLHTLSGQNMYTNAKWSDPFDNDGKLEIINSALSVESLSKNIKIYPNPASDILSIEFENEVPEIIIFDALGEIHFHGKVNGSLNVSTYPNGKYFIKIGKISYSFIKV